MSERPSAFLTFEPKSAASSAPAIDALDIARGVAEHLGDGTEWTGHPFVFRSGTRARDLARLTRASDGALVFVFVRGGRVRFRAEWPGGIPLRYRKRGLAMNRDAAMPRPSLAREFTRHFLPKLERARSQFVRTPADKEEGAPR